MGCLERALLYYILFVVSFILGWFTYDWVDAWAKHIHPYRFPYIGKPFKGQWFYEIQVGPIVFQYRHKNAASPEWRRKMGKKTNFFVWCDSTWWHNVTRKVR